MNSIVKITTENFHRFLNDILKIETQSFPSPWSPGTFGDEVKRPVSHLWTLIEDEKFAGYICFWLIAGEIHLLNIAIHPDKRGKGLGQYLIEKMIEAGLAERAEMVWLEVRPSNTAARRLYKKIGFMEIGRRPMYYSDTKEEAIIMTLPLSQMQQSDILHEDGMSAEPYLYPN